MFLSWLVRFSLYNTDISEATLGYPALPYKLLEGILEMRTPFGYTIH